MSDLCMGPCMGFNMLKLKMKKKRAEKRQTNAWSRRIVHFIRFLMRRTKNIVGKELFLDTDEGKVRVLIYNFENKDKLPLYVNLHGGGFTIGSAEMDDPFMMNLVNNANVKIINVDYSLAPDMPFPIALNECYAVVKYAKEHAEELGIDADRIALGGQSAGGNFTAAVCLLDNERKTLGLKCLILDYPPMDVYTDAALKPHPKGSLPIFLSRLFDDCYCADKEKRKNPLLSPVYASVAQVSSFPPTLMITAGRDSLCEEAEKFRNTLLEAGVDVTHKRFDDAIHGFNLNPGADADESWEIIIKHLNKYLWN